MPQRNRDTGGRGERRAPFTRVSKT